MAGEIAIPISVYAASEASKAKHAAERAEMQAFVNGYNHATATPEQRQRYVDAVKFLYPLRVEKTAAEVRQEVIAQKVVGGFMLSIPLFLVVGAVYGKLVFDDVEEGLHRGFMTWVACIAFIFVTGFLAVGMWLLFR